MLTSHQPSESRPASTVGSFANEASVNVIGCRSVPKNTLTVVVFVLAELGVSGAGFAAPPPGLPNVKGGLAFCPVDGLGAGGTGSAGGVGDGGGGDGSPIGGSAPAVGGAESAGGGED